jgi:hypothetical protein
LNSATLSDFRGEWVLVSDGQSIDLTIDSLTQSRPFSQIGTFTTRGTPNLTGKVYGRCYADELQFQFHVTRTPPSRLSQYRYNLQLIGDKQMAGTNREGSNSPMVGVYAYRKQGWQDPREAGVEFTQSTINGKWMLWGGREMDLPEALGLSNPGGSVGQWQRPVNIRLNGSRVSSEIGDGAVGSIDGSGRQFRIDITGTNGDFMMIYRHEYRPGLATGFLYKRGNIDTSNYAANTIPVILIKDPGVRITVSEQPDTSINSSAIALQAMNSPSNKCNMSYTRYLMLAGKNSNIDGQRLCKDAARSDQPVQCYSKIMSGGVNWGRGTQWNPTNALDLCEGSLNAETTISCFSKKIEQGITWQKAIQSCGR